MCFEVNKQMINKDIFSNIVMLGCHHGISSLMTEKVVHRSRRNGLDIQPDMILVRFVCFRLCWVFDPD